MAPHNPSGTGYVPLMRPQGALRTASSVPADLSSTSGEAADAARQLLEGAFFAPGAGGGDVEAPLCATSPSRALSPFSNVRAPSRARTPASQPASASTKSSSSSSSSTVTAVCRGAAACGALAAIPATVLLARLAYIGLAILYCIVTLKKGSIPITADDDWFRDSPGLHNATAEAAAWPVPKIIHQTYKNSSIPARWRAAADSCTALHLDYQYMFWTDASARAFLEKEYRWFLPTFDSYPYSIQRADALRYFVLHHYGGIYADLDVGCQFRLDGLRQYPVVLPTTEPAGFSNDVMVAAPRHPFMLMMIKGLKAHNHYYGTKYPTVMFSTGPMYLTMQYVRFKGAAKQQIYAMAGRLYNDHGGGPRRALFKHYHGSSWHGSDSQIIFWLFNTLTWSLPVITLLVGVLLGHFGTLLLQSKKQQWVASHLKLF